LAAQRAVTGGGIRVSATQFPLTHLGIAWQGSQARVRIQTAAGWTDWTEVHGCPGGRDGKAEAAAAVVLVAPGAVSYELAIGGAGVGAVTELNTVDGPTAAAAAAAAPPTAGLPLPDGTFCPVIFVNRAGWGADESLRFSAGTEIWPPEYFPVQALTVHHSAGTNNDPNPAATMRAIYYYQCVTQGWGDIGYNLLIDEAGRVYEGRVSGGTTIPIFAGVVGPGKAPQLNTPGHVLGYNVGNVGVCLLGDLTSVGPTPAAQKALATVLAGLARTNGVNPLGGINYFNPVNGNGGAVNAISGHRNWAATQCPGNTFYPTMPTIRAMTFALTHPIQPRRPA